MNLFAWANYALTVSRSISASVYKHSNSEEGDKITDIYSAPATTQPPYEGPLAFGIEIIEADNVMDTTGTPDHDGVCP